MWKRQKEVSIGRGRGGGGEHGANKEVGVGQGAEEDVCGGDQWGK